MTTRTSKHRPGRPALLLLLLLAACSPSMSPAVRASRLAEADADLNALHPVLRTYPPRLSSEEQRRQVLGQWRQAEANLLELADANPDDARIQWRLGVLYRLGHNLDVPDAGAQCVDHLERAISLQPNFVDAYLELGIFYTDAGRRWVPLGETNLRKAIELAKPRPLPRAWKALAYATYFQGHYADSVAAADEYLSMVPTDQELLRFRGLAERAAASGTIGPPPAGRIVVP